MRRTIEKAPSVCGARGFGYHSSRPQNTAVLVSAQENKLAPDAGKSLAMWLYNCGAFDLAQAQATFDRCPDWRHA